MDKRTHVVIIGAGAAGISAASKLLENGFSNFVILEAKDRIGGRLHSVPFGGGSVDLGAEWVHGETGNVAYEMSKPYELIYTTINPFDTSQVYRSDGKLINGEIYQELLEMCYEIIDHSFDTVRKYEGSLGAFFEENFWPRVEPLIQKGKLTRQEAEDWVFWMEKMENSIDGSPDWKQTSVKEAVEYVKVPGEVLIAWKSRGYSTILDILTKKIPNPNKALDVESRVMLNKEVTRIDWSGHGVEVTCADGTAIKADRVLTTVSLNVLKAVADNIYKPSLPRAHLNAIQGLGMGTIDKIFLKFPYRWWPAGSGGISCFWRAEDRAAVPENLKWTISIFGFYRLDSQPLTSLCGWIGGEAAIAMESLTDEEVLKACMGVLRRFAGSTLEIPEPSTILRSRWGTDPHVRGSYSCRMISSDRLNVWPSDLAHPVRNSVGEPVLLFAGEATHQHFFSTVHGAIETGWREADRILAMRKREERSTVLVVGAGIAGLSAAKVLSENGIDTIVLEAQDKPGGRIQSVKSSGAFLELGAQWLHGQNTSLYKYASKQKLVDLKNSESEGNGRYCLADGSAVPLQIVREVNNVVESILKDCENFVVTGDSPSNLAEEMDRRFNKYLSRFSESDTTIRKHLFSWHKRFQMIDNSCNNLEKLSAQAWGLYKDCGSNHNIPLTPTIASLVTSLAADLPKNALRLRCPAKRINWLPCIDPNDERPRVTIFCDDAVFNADHVIVTVPLGVLKENKLKMFHPVLPDSHNQAIDQLGFGNVTKLFLEFEESWWGAEKGFQLVWTENPALLSQVPWASGVTGFDVVRDRPVLLCWIGGEAARVVEQEQEEKLRTEAAILLRIFTGRKEVPVPRCLYRSGWNSNEFIRGSYCHVTSGCDPSNIDCGTLAEPVYTHNRNKTGERLPTLLLAGEACHRSHYSTLHGAYESGQQQAKVIIDYLGRRKSSKL